jgi:hypothetical protein
MCFAFIGLRHCRSRCLLLSLSCHCGVTLQACHHLLRLHFLLLLMTVLLSSAAFRLFAKTNATSNLQPAAAGDQHGEGSSSSSSKLNTSDDVILHSLSDADDKVWAELKLNMAFQHVSPVLLPELLSPMPLWHHDMLHSCQCQIVCFDSHLASRRENVR